MATFRIVHRDSVPCMAAVGKDGESFEMVEVDAADHASSPTVLHLHPGSAAELQLFEAELPPGTEAESHAHLTDEIIYVLDGALVAGAQTLGPGDSVYIGAETLYSFEAGPEGLRYLNFRARRDDSHLSKSQLMERRANRAET